MLDGDVRSWYQFLTSWKSLFIQRLPLNVNTAPIFALLDSVFFTCFNGGYKEVITHRIFLGSVSVYRWQAFLRKTCVRDGIEGHSCSSNVNHLCHSLAFQARHVTNQPFAFHSFLERDAERVTRGQLPQHYKNEHRKFSCETVRPPNLARKSPASSVSSIVAIHTAVHLQSWSFGPHFFWISCGFIPVFTL